MGRTARLILSLLLPILTLSMITLLISYLMARETTPLYAIHYHRGMLEYIFAALAITVGGALLGDIVDHDLKGK